MASDHPPPQPGLALLADRIARLRAETAEILANTERILRASRAMVARCRTDGAEEAGLIRPDLGR